MVRIMLFEAADGSSCARLWFFFCRACRARTGGKTRVFLDHFITKLIGLPKMSIVRDGVLLFTRNKM